MLCVTYYNFERYSTIKCKLRGRKQMSALLTLNRLPRGNSMSLSCVIPIGAITRPETTVMLHFTSTDGSDRILLAPRPGVSFDRNFGEKN